MIIISHRGNLNGPSSKENSPSHILAALNEGFDVEVDTWLLNGNFYLGHDFLQYKTDLDFLMTEGLWVHCKNLQAVSFLSKFKKINCFAHKEDDFVLSSYGFVLLPPKMGYAQNCVTMMPELNKEAKIVKGCGGIITDFPIKYR